MMYQSYVRATSIEEALSALSQAKKPVQVVAGGTDLLLQGHHGNGTEVMSLVDISDIEELSGLQVTPTGLRIGAATRLADIERSNLLTGGWQTLMEGVVEVGSIQIRHLATIGGNICNASPSADTVPPLLVLDAVATAVSPRGQRDIPLTEFFVGPGETVLEEDEILVSVLIPQLPANATGTYIKLKVREALDLAFVGVSVLLSQTEDNLDARIALGAVAPTPIRATQAEALLAESSRPDEAAIRDAALLASKAASPISDVRASAEYRLEMVRNLTERALRQVALKSSSSMVEGA